MEKVATFRYSAFYIIQPIIAVGILCLALFIMVFYFKPPSSSKAPQLVAWIILFCFLGFSMLKGVLLILKRIREPVGVELSAESISAVYRNGKAIQILWDDIKRIHIRRDRWRFGAESIEITSKANSKAIIVKDDIRDYEILRDAISDKNMEKIETG